MLFCACIEGCIYQRPNSNSKQNSKFIQRNLRKAFKRIFECVLKYIHMTFLLKTYTTVVKYVTWAHCLIFFCFEINMLIMNGIMNIHNLEEILTFLGDLYMKIEPFCKLWWYHLILTTVMPIHLIILCPKKEKKERKDNTSIKWSILQNFKP